MNINEIKKSGLLELYVIGELIAEEITIVENALIEFPSLKQDLVEIESAFQLYANANSISAPTSILDSVLSNIDSVKNNTPKQNLVDSPKEVSIWTKYLPLASLLGLLGLSMALYTSNNKFNTQKAEYETILKDCNDEKSEHLQQLLILESINDNGNQVIFAEATKKYPSTVLYFNHNPVTARNIIQVQNLPGLTAEQSYQLWSLKGDNPPRPLDVFQDDVNKIFEVTNVSETETYAITIEPKGGQNSPTLANLVALIKMPV